MSVAEVVFLFPAGQGSEVERDAGLYSQVAAEVREGVGQLRQRCFHLRVNGVDVLTHGLFFLYFHHKRDGAHKHTIGLAHSRVATPVVDGRVGHLLLAQQAGQHVAERSLE